MDHRAAQLQERIDAVIRRLQHIQRGIAGSRQPASRLELEALEALGRDYARLQRELHDWYAASRTGDAHDDRSR